MTNIVNCCEPAFHPQPEEDGFATKYMYLMNHYDIISLDHAYEKDAEHLQILKPDEADGKLSNGKNFCQKIEWIFFKLTKASEDGDAVDISSNSSELLASRFCELLDDEEERRSMEGGFGKLLEYCCSILQKKENFMKFVQFFPFFANY